MSGFGPTLRRKRLAAGLTQQELAQRAGLSVRALSDLERGVSRPHRKTVTSLTDALGLAEAGHAGRRRAARPRPAAGTPRQLPPAPAGFTGRSAELKILAGLLARDDGAAGAVVVSAIGGTAGVGKTALAV
ncbi:MAG: helix-turn-helix domain-containing protein, partial [Streptosporangiaceae bacterium]